MTTGGPATGADGGRLAHRLSAAGVVLLRKWRRLVLIWQRSLQLRVIAATLALSFVVVSLLGVTLTRQITDDLLEQQKDAAVDYASVATRSAQESLNATVGEVDYGDQERIVRDLAARGGPDGPGLVMQRPNGGAASTLPDYLPSTLSEELRTAINEDPTQLWWAYTTIEYADGRSSEPGIVVGGQVVAPTVTADERYALYFVFSLSDTEQTLGVVRAALSTAGLLVVLLLGAIAGLVTRQVVTPVRMAAKIAGRFSDGRLSERMAVRGKDDISKLATSFNQMAGSLQQQIAELEELSRIQQQFASDVSHELRTPLTTVRMAADVLHESREDFDPVVQRAAELLQAQLDRFEALLADLLEISRFDAGVAKLNAEPVDMRDLVHSAADSCEHIAARKGGRVRLEVPAESCMAEIDERRIERVLRNLLVNGIEHGEGRDVVVRVAANEQAVAVGVRDYGVGLKPGEASLVFHRFWRADPARARTTGGTGLGLAISLEDARLHGGWLQAWGGPGAGSHFLLTLPRKAGADIVAGPLALMPPDAVFDGRLGGVGGPYQRVAGEWNDPAGAADASGTPEPASDAPDGRTGADGDDPAAGPQTDVAADPRGPDASATSGPDGGGHPVEDARPPGGSLGGGGAVVSAVVPDPIESGTAAAFEIAPDTQDKPDTRDRVAGPGESSDESAEVHGA